MGLFNKNDDEALAQLADLLFDFEDEEYFVVNQDFFRKFQGNYSFVSLDALQDYLKKIKPDKAEEEQVDSTILQCGAYLGEVVRRRSDRNYHWYDFDKLAKKHPFLKDMEWELWLDNVLFSEETGRFLFPSQIVKEALGRKDGLSIRTWAEQKARKKEESLALARGLIIEADDTGIRIAGTPVSFPTTLEDLEKILGPLSESIYHNGWHGVWDDYGIEMTYHGDGTVDQIALSVKPVPHWPLKPLNPFSGTLILKGQALAPGINQTTLLGKGDQEVIAWSNEDSRGFRIGRNILYKEDLPPDYYTIKPLNEPVLSFKDFNFKLCVIQELMYNQKLLKPKFDLDQFVDWYQGRKIDLDEEGDEEIPEAVQYFKDLPIPQRLAEKVTELYQDGGDDIYLNLIRQWDGEDDRFCVESAVDAAQFPNLKKATFIMITDEAFDEFDELGLLDDDEDEDEDESDEEEPVKPAKEKPQWTGPRAPLTYKNSGPSITEAQLKKVEKVVGCDLPDDYRAFLLKVNGGEPSRTRFDFEAIEGNETSSSIDCFFSVLPDGKSENDLVRNIKFWWGEERIIDTFVPIGRDIAGNIIVLGVEEDDFGPVYFFDCDVEGDYEPEENWVPLADSFEDFLRQLQDEED